LIPKGFVDNHVQAPPSFEEDSMVLKNKYNGIDEYASNLIRIKANQLIGKAGFTEDDRKDLEQELMLDLLMRMRFYDSSKSKRSTFMSVLVERHAATILESRQAQRRSYRRQMISLNATPSNCDSEPEELNDCLSGDGTFQVHLTGSIDDREWDIGLDLRRFIASLPEDLRELCQHLCSGNKAKIARTLKIHRTTIYLKLKALREALLKQGLQEYL
jgi:RNA polymerase sigma-70 factor (ECF subfamily)